MDYKQLQFFLAVCEAQSFRNAAARCYVSQQAISKSLSNLEQELGVQLFVRNQNGVSLTEAGQQLEKLARPHLNQRDEILRQMRSFHSKQQLHIGYFMGFLQELLRISSRNSRNSIQKSSCITTVIPIPNTAAVIVITTVTLSSQLRP